MKNKDELKKNTDDIHFAALHENDEHESEDTVDAAEFYEDSDVYEDDDAYEDDQYHSYSAESREKAERSRKRRAWKVQAEKIVIGILIALLICAGVVYVAGCVYFDSHFGFHTTISGRDVSCKSTEQVRTELSASAASYELAIHGRGNVTAAIPASEVSLSLSFDNTLEQLLSAQSSMEWPATLFSSTTLSMSNTAVYDSSALEQVVDTLPFFDPENEEAPEDATYALSGDSYQIVPETAGSVPIREKVLQAVETALSEYQSDLSLGDECYETAAVTSEDPSLNETVARLNRLVGITVTIPFGDDTETLGGETLASLIHIPASDQAKTSEEIAADAEASTSSAANSGAAPEAVDNEIHYDAERIASYVDSLADKYDTYGIDRKFHTTSGKTVTVSGGNYGWKMDRAATTEALTAFLEAGNSGEAEPVWTQEAAQHGEDDIGSSYAEVDLDEQKVYLYIDGERVVETDCVSGKAISSDRFTPDGTFRLLYRKSPAVLRGADYESPVTYWMPFNRGIGFHDATWRSRFGGEIYLTAGSHGCVNLPFAAAKELYENVYSGLPVVVFGGMKPEEAASHTGRSPEKPSQTQKPAASAADNAAAADSSSADQAASAAAAAQAAQASVIAQAVQNYMAQGMSEAEAHAKVQADLAAQLAAQQAAASQGQE